MVDEALKALVASGPLAILLGLAVWVLWKKVNTLSSKLESVAKSHVKKLDEVRAECTTREDNMRVHYEQQIANEREENKALWREVNATLKGLVEGE